VDARQRAFRVIAQAAAVLPLLFTFFTAVVPEYGAQFHVLFGFLMLIALGLTAIAHWRGPEWLHHLGGASVVITMFIWFSVSYTPKSWPWILLWLAAFIALYLTRISYAAAALFFAFTALGIREQSHDATLTGVMLVLLAALIGVALLKAKPMMAASAIALSSIALMTIAPALRILLGSHALLFAAILFIAWISKKHVLALLAIPFFIAMLLTADIQALGMRLAFALVPYALFLAYAWLAKESRAAQVAACLASAVFFFSAYDALKYLGYEDVIGLLPLVQALLLAALFRRGRNVVVAGTALAFFTTAIPLQFNRPWTAVFWALEATALAWVYTRAKHIGLLVWSFGLAIFVCVWLPSDSSLHEQRYVVLAAAAAMFVAAYLPTPSRFAYATMGTIELFVLMNFEIGRYYEGAASSLAQDLTYTIAWALFAIAMLVIGIAMRTRATRIAALGLLAVTVLKCFLHDLGQLGGLYRVASLFGLAVSLVLVGLLLQKFVIMRPDAETSHAPTGTT
jgi:uncharacterized membrane protein